MFLWHNYFLIGFIQLLIIILLDIVYTKRIFEKNPFSTVVVIMLLWPVFDTVLLGFAIKEWKEKKILNKWIKYFSGE